MDDEILKKLGVLSTKIMPVRDMDWHRYTERNTTTDIFLRKTLSNFIESGYVFYYWGWIDVLSSFFEFSFILLTVFFGIFLFLEMACTLYKVFSRNGKICHQIYYYLSNKRHKLNENSDVVVLK
ncbi:hypothetical protein [Xenorhabdus szentirmaii]|uniref:hypothetical protein n=1 Tax=Xenorhabdus szentirmaii TaxID=290112 RepID=UPI0019A50559|nr:hypothetical protein [Xenorhabdus sp. 38]MBD2779061.1 hypothetical protein [Xenorhabdus sp. 38]